MLRFEVGLEKRVTLSHNCESGSAFLEIRAWLKTHVTWNCKYCNKAQVLVT